MTCIIIPSNRFANFIWTTIAFILLSTSPLVSSFSRNPFVVPQLEHTIHTTQIPLHLTEVKQLDLDLDTSVSTEPIADLLHDYQTVAQQITSSFSFQPFQPISTFPLSILSQNNHVQTIAGTLWRDKSACTYIPSKNFFPTGIWKFFLDPGNDTQNGLDWYDERKCISTPDHDFFHVDFKYQNRESRGTVIIVHGLESNSASPLVVDMARSFYDKGFDVACVNFRGCSGEVNQQPGAYHLGFTNDLKLLLTEMVQKQTSTKPVYLSAFSLGANVVVKVLGELGTAAKDTYNIQGAAISCCPYDTVKCAEILSTPGINKDIYTPAFVQNMQTKIKEKYESKYIESVSQNESFPFDYEAVMNATTINQIEDAYIAPIYGYDNYKDYYEHNACKQFIPGIAIPVLAINAKDDPFFHPEMEFPNISPNPFRLCETDHGGHCGFMFHAPTLKHDEPFHVPKTSWMPNELARFIDHVDKHNQ